MKKILFLTILSALFVFGGEGISLAHCGKCGEGHAKTEKMQPCEKCMKAGKTCQCGAKKPCEKTMDEKEPCEKCAESEKKFEEAKTGSHLKSNIGSLQMKSRGKVDTGYND